MNSFEFNKLFAAFLVAGITAMLSSFIAEKTQAVEMLDRNAVEIEGVVVADAGAAAGAAAATGPEPIAHLLASADVARGEKLSKACAACHSFDKGGANKVGPNLWGVVGAQKGHHEGFAYSDAMKAKGGTWGFDDLNHFLFKPKDYINGTKMTYAGLKKPEDRAALIAWLRSLSDSPAAFPAATAPAPATETPAAGGTEAATPAGETPATASTEEPKAH